LVARIVRDDEVGGSNPLAPTKLSNLAFQLHHGRQGDAESEICRVRAEFEFEALKPKDVDLAKIADTIACRPAVPESAHRVGSDRR
jgi:hypothetical protein